MIRPFQKFYQFLNLIKTQPRRRLQVPGLNLERLSGSRLRRQTQAQKPVYHLLERLPRFAGLFFQQAGYIVIERKSSAHIMML
jgi:hypothetical protein